MHPLYLARCKSGFHCFYRPLYVTFDACRYYKSGISFRPKIKTVGIQWSKDGMEALEKGFTNSGLNQAWQLMLQA
jgi:hypothetical protein